MIISEKQITGLINYANSYISTLLELKKHGFLTEDGATNLERVISLLSTITNQQSNELKEIK